MPEQDGEMSTEQLSLPQSLRLASMQEQSSNFRSSRNTMNRSPSPVGKGISVDFASQLRHRKTRWRTLFRKKFVAFSLFQPERGLKKSSTKSSDFIEPGSKNGRMQIMKSKKL